jgi:hypothetical protein
MQSLLLITEKREGRFVPMLLAMYAWIVLSLGMDCTLGVKCPRNSDISTRVNYRYSRAGRSKIQSTFEECFAIVTRQQAIAAFFVHLAFKR